MSDWLPPEIKFTAMWTELVEMNDWDEDEAAACIVNVAKGNTTIISQRAIEISKIIIALTSRQPKTMVAES